MSRSGCRRWRRVRSTPAPIRSTCTPRGSRFSSPRPRGRCPRCSAAGCRFRSDDVNSVQILNPSHGFQAPLSSADLTDPTRYQDPQAPDALPVISVDGTEDQTTYIRPFRGGADANAGDEVTEAGAPITLVVYANGPPLIVHAYARTLSSNATATRAKLGATVQTATGAPVPTSGLNWSWTFGDGGTSAAATPTHRFAAGSYEVTVQVTDVAAGTGGTATIQFRTPAAPTPGHTNQTGGSKPTKSTSPTGTENGKHSTHQGGQTGSHRSAGSGGARSTTTSSQSTTTTQSTTSTRPTTTADRRPQRRNRRRARPPPRPHPRPRRRQRRDDAPPHFTTPAHTRRADRARRAARDRTPDQQRHDAAGRFQPARPPNPGCSGGPTAASPGDALAEPGGARRGVRGGVTAGAGSLVRAAWPPPLAGRVSAPLTPVGDADCAAG